MKRAKIRKIMLYGSLATVVCLLGLLCLRMVLPSWLRYDDSLRRSPQGYRIGPVDFDEKRPNPTITIEEPSDGAQLKLGDRVRVVVHCGMPEGSVVPSAIIAILRRGKAIFASRSPEIRPSERGGYDGEVLFEGPKAPGEYSITVQCYDRVRMPDGPKSKSMVTSEASISFKVNGK